MSDTTEKLRIEIEVAAREARSEVRGLSQEMKALSAEAKALPPPSREIKEVLSGLERELKNNESAARLFDDKLGGLKERQALLKSAMRDLIDNGIVPEAQELKSLKSQYDEAGKEIRSFNQENDNLAEKLGKLAATGAALAAANRIKEFAGSAISDFAEAEAASQRLDLALEMRGMADAAPRLAALRAQLKDLAGIDDDVTRQLQAQLIAQGKSEIETNKIIRAAAGMSAVEGSLAENVQKLEVSYAGVTGGIGRQIPELKDLTDEQLKSGAAVDILLQKYEGFIGKTGDTSIALARMDASIEDAKKALGEGLAPIATEGARAITKFSSAIASLPEPLKRAGGVITTVLLSALGALLLRTTILTAAEWGFFGAKMASASAMAVFNPLLWAGVAAATAAIGVTALFVAKQKEEAAALQATADKANAAATSYQNMSGALKQAATDTGNFDAAAEIASKVNVLKAQKRELEASALITSSSVGQGIARLNEILNSPVDPKSTIWCVYKSDAEKFKAAMDTLNSFTDKDVAIAIQKAEGYQKAVAEKSIAGLKAALTTIDTMPKATRAQINAIDAQIKALESGTTITPLPIKPVVTPPDADLGKKAKEWASTWSREFAKAQAESSSNPYASLDLEKTTKTEELKKQAPFLDSKEVERITGEIASWYTAKSKEISDSIAKDEADTAAKLTATKVDDLQLEQAAQIANLKTLEVKDLAAAGLTEQQKTAIHNRYEGLRAQVDTKYAQEISDTQKKEAADAAAASFDLANKDRAFSANLTESKIDDLELERDRALAIFTGSEAQRAALAEMYAKKIATTEIDEARVVAEAKIAADRKVFEERLKAAKDTKDYGAYFGLSAQEATKDTQVGQMLGFGGAAKADPMIVLTDAAIKFALSMESVQKLMNAFDTGLSGMKKIVDGILGAGTEELANSIVAIGSALGNVAAPFLSLFVLGLKIVTAVINMMIIPTLNQFGEVFGWLSDKVIVPIGNAIIGAINWLITQINKLPGKDIALLDTLKTTAEIAEKEKQIAEKTDAVNEAMSDLQTLFDEKKNGLKEAYDENISSLKNLLELGAINETDYASRVSTANANYATSLASLNADEKAQLATLQEILSELQAGNDISKTALHAAGVAGYAAGAIEIPQNQVAIVHKGEIVIPKSFSEGLRSGELSLSKKGGSGATIIYQTTVSVAGSVVSEDGLIETLATKIDRKTNRGQLERA